MTESERQELMIIARKLTEVEVQRQTELLLQQQAELRCQIAALRGEVDRLSHGEQTQINPAWARALKGVKGRLIVPKKASK